MASPRRLTLVNPSGADVPQPEIQLRPAAPIYEGDRVVATCRADANPRAVQ